MQSALVTSYQRHFKGSDEEIKQIMSNDTWLTAAEMAEKFNNVEVLANEVKIAATMDMSKLGEVPEQAKAFLAKEEPAEREIVIEDKSLWALLKRKVGAEARLPQEKQVEQEDTMTPEEEKAELVEEITGEVKTGVMAALKEAGVIKAKEEPKTPATAKVEVEFEGDMDNPEDVAKHQAKLERAQLKASVDWNDVESVAKYHAAIAKTEPTAKLPAGNADTPAGEEKIDKAQDRKDTSSFMAKHLPRK